MKSLVKAVRIAIDGAELVSNLLVLVTQNVQHGSVRIQGRLYVRNRNRCVLGSNFVANSGLHKNPIGGDTICRLIVGKRGALLIGDDCGISNSTIVCQEKISIGSGVRIGGGCKIWDTNFHSLKAAYRLAELDSDISTSPIAIGDRVFLGAGSVVLKGISIGNDSVIAAGSVVVKDVPANEVWGGNPARFVKKLVG